MKLNEENQVKDQTEIHAEAELRKQIKKLGSLRDNGQPLWRVNQETREVSLATFEEPEKKAILTSLDAKIKAPNKKIIVESGFWYVQAGTKKSAIKKYDLELLQIKEKEMLQKRQDYKLMQANKGLVIRSIYKELERLLEQDTDDFRELVRKRVIDLKLADENL